MTPMDWARGARLLVAVLVVVLGVQAPPPTASAAHQATWSGPQVIREPPRVTGWAVSCGSAAACRTASEFGTSALFDGERWHRARGIDRNYGSLSDISCPTTDVCGAVGAHRAVFRTAHGWGRVHVAPMRLSSISCTSHTFCAVAGDRGDVGVWDGYHWSHHVSLSGADLDPARVSCSSSSHCLAVDRDGRVARWDGTGWRVHRLLASRQPEVPGISCPTDGTCFVVTHDNRVRRWHRGAWGPSHRIAPDDTRHARSIDCASAADCLVVGNGLAIRRVDGAWRARRELPDELMDVSCPRAGTCVATTGTPLRTPSGDHSVFFRGGRLTRADYRPPRLASAFIAVDCLASAWCMVVDGRGGSATYDGKAWQPHTGPLNGVDDVHPSPYTWLSCSAKDFCMAMVGTDGYSSWDGTAWSRPQLMPGPGEYSGVSCTSAAFCLATTFGGSASTWDGTGWGTASPVDPAGLFYVSCWGEHSCFASNGSSVRLFDGTSWGDRQQVTFAGRHEGIWDLSCKSDTFCAALGPEAVAFWDGTAWMPGGTFDQRGTDLACASPTSCTVISNGTHASQHWDGNQWQSPQRMMPAGYSSEYHRISCARDLCVTVDTNVSAFVRR